MPCRYPRERIQYGCLLGSKHPSDRKEHDISTTSEIQRLSCRLRHQKRESNRVEKENAHTAERIPHQLPEPHQRAAGGLCGNISSLCDIVLVAIIVTINTQSGEVVKPI
ncbi:hypothetical protein ACFQL7_21440 [Halocatena marina]|uniref:Uncharacterized protein n=1 Tax=Halocatena marina TaxID=2934937 RepID=A0ABD5YV72_9EURY